MGTPCRGCGWQKSGAVGGCRTRRVWMLVRAVRRAFGTRARPRGPSSGGSRCHGPRPRSAYKYAERRNYKDSLNGDANGISPAEKRAPASENCSLEKRPQRRTGPKPLKGVKGGESPSGSDPVAPEGGWRRVGLWGMRQRAGKFRPKLNRARER
ncbi:hypothetical protein C4D60_Mb01t29840 [Musa balbisiana]|uniref:Uncharacterized protein n=1 Tax=Musa balbisiana TaxID=52838 RepID=A0A4S8JRQ9_MUSBA|nr:hypothetical protein C4D60_Mb01t29840 [Musa balbisiana]